MIEKQTKKIKKPKREVCLYLKFNEKVTNYLNFALHVFFNFKKRVKQIVFGLPIALLLISLKPIGFPQVPPVKLIEQIV